MNKTKINAKVLADSTNEFGNRITTMIVTFPRYILAELNTHRMFSKNSASSRAIPFKRLLESVDTNPFIPIAWMKDHTGMQGSEYFTDETMLRDLQQEYLVGKDLAVTRAKIMSNLGLTKQIVNRGLEPYMWHTVLITATEWENFFALRCPQYWLGNPMNPNAHRSKKDAIKDVETIGFAPVNKPFDIWTDIDWLKMNRGLADIHMMALAESIWDAYNESTPKELKAGEWHIPFGEDMEDVEFQLADDDGRPCTKKEIDEFKIKIATARCARVSYTIVGDEGKPADYEADIKLHDRLSTSGHWSCFEHCAKTMTNLERLNNIIITFDEKTKELKKELGVSGNFRGFIQYRKTFNNENITK